MLFSKKIKPEVVKEKCCSEGVEVKETISPNKNNSGQLSVKILGSGCAKCNQLESAALQAIKELNMEAQVEHITDFAAIAGYGVMTTPALVINEMVVSSGKVLKVEQIIDYLQKHTK